MSVWNSGFLWGLDVHSFSQSSEMPVSSLDRFLWLQFSPWFLFYAMILRFVLLLLPQDSWDLWSYPLQYCCISGVFAHSVPPDLTTFFSWLICWFLLDSLSFSFQWFFFSFKNLFLDWICVSCCWLFKFINCCFSHSFAPLSSVSLSLWVLKQLGYFIHLTCMLGEESFLVFTDKVSKSSSYILLVSVFSHSVVGDLLEESHFCACLCSLGSCPMVCTPLGARSSLCYLVLF